MKARFSLLGCLVAILCLPGCSDDNEVTVSEITISPGTFPALEVGGTVELTAVITPDNATEEIRWVAYDPIVSIAGEGRKAVLTAVESGTTRIFATNRTGVVVSEEITVKVNSDEFASFVVGKYIGTAEVRGSLNADLSGVSVTMERIKDENAQVKLTVVADVPSLGELTITGERISVKPGAEPETYTLNGAAPLEFPGIGTVPLTVSGTYRAAEKSLALSLAAENIISINIAATPGAPADYGAAIAGDYAGTGKLTGNLMTADLDGVQITLARLGNSKAGLSITAPVPGLGEQVISSDDITLSAGTAPNTCALSGTVLMTPMPATTFELDVTGTFDMTTHALTLDLVDPNGMINIHLDVMPVGFDPSDYGKIVAGKYLGSAVLKGLVNEEVSGVQITLERVDSETVKISVKATVTGVGEVPIDGDAITVSEGNASGTCVLSGTANGMGMPFSVAGTFNAADRTLTLKLAVEGVITIDITAEAQEDEPPVNYAEIVAGNYTGSAVLKGMLNTTLTDMPVKLETIDGETEIVKLTMEATVPTIGKITITCDELAVLAPEKAGSCRFSGETVLPMLNLSLAVEGTYDDATRTLAITMKAEGDAITIAYTGTK